jgi:pyruvate dehydrogenase E1 component
MSCERWNLCHPNEPPRKPHIQAALESEPWPVISASDYVRGWSERLGRWTPAGMRVLGTDGFGRSGSREGLRRFFEVDAPHIAYAALYELANSGQFDRKKLPRAASELSLDLDTPDPWTV